MMLVGGVVVYVKNQVNAQPSLCEIHPLFNRSCGSLNCCFVNGFGGEERVYGAYAEGCISRLRKTKRRRDVGVGED